VNDKYVVSTKNDQQTYDAVVIGAPLEKCNIQFKNLPLVTTLFDREFVSVCLTIVVGVVNPNYFGYEHTEDVPQVIRTTVTADQHCKFLTFQALWYDSVRNEKIIKVQSLKELSDQDLKQMFSKISFVHKHKFEYGYPRLRPLHKNEKLPARFRKGLYYINSVESLSSAMEASCWSGKNIAQILVHDIFPELDK
jgi:hypothetical protein